MRLTEVLFRYPVPPPELRRLSAICDRLDAADGHKLELRGHHLYVDEHFIYPADAIARSVLCPSERPDYLSTIRIDPAKAPGPTIKKARKKRTRKPSA